MCPRAAGRVLRGHSRRPGWGSALWSWLQTCALGQGAGHEGVPCRDTWIAEVAGWGCAGRGRGCGAHGTDPRVTGAGLAGEATRAAGVGPEDTQDQGRRPLPPVMSPRGPLQGGSCALAPGKTSTGSTGANLEQAAANAPRPVSARLRVSLPRGRAPDTNRQLRPASQQTQLRVLDARKAPALPRKQEAQHPAGLTLPPTQPPAHPGFRINYQMSFQPFVHKIKTGKRTKNDSHIEKMLMYHKRVGNTHTAPTTLVSAVCPKAPSRPRALLPTASGSAGRPARREALPSPPRACVLRRPAFPVASPVFR